MVYDLSLLTDKEIGSSETGRGEGEYGVDQGIAESSAERNIRMYV